MAATLQSQQINPQLKALVYSKYRELLGSYNGKANSIIQSMPAYMVTRDEGFQLDSLEDVDRYQTQPCNAPPACVQNAMMTKDKKPFTYTPGGIDLSEIRSPRMAKRIARNAQYEGVTGLPKPSPLATNSSSGAPPPPPPMLPSGMPVQVFPTGPPTPPSAPHPPPPPPPKQQLAPPQPATASSPQNFEPPPMGCRPEIKIPPNPMATLKKVPPPRPKDDFWVEEYRKEKSKSPSMVRENGDSYPRSQQNGNAHVGMNEPRYVHDENDQGTLPREDIPQRPLENHSIDQQRQQQQLHQPPEQRQYQQQQYQRPYQQQTSVQQRRSPSPIRNTVSQRLEPKRTDSPFQTDDHPNLQRPLSPIKLNQGQQKPHETPTNNSQTSNRTISSDVSQQKPSPSSASPSSASSSSSHAKHVGTGSLYIPPVAPENLAVNKQKQQQSEKPTMNSPQAVPAPSRDVPEKLPWMSQKPSKEVPEWVREEANNSPGPAVKTQPTNYSPVPSSAKTQLPPQNREWVREEPHYSPVKAPQPNQQSQFNFQPKPMSNSGNASGSERIVPIQFEPQSPHTRTPSTANSVSEQGYSSPTYAPPGYINRTPNQFVDQGYNNYPQQWQNQSRDDTPTQPQPQPQPYNWRTQNRVTSPPTPQQQQSQQRPIQNRVASPPVHNPAPQQNWSSPPVQQSPPMTGVTRIIPIQIEGQETPFNPSVRGPIMQSPTVIQNDPRTLHHQNSWGGLTPNQSKSFKILQKITDTDLKEEDPSERMKRMHVNEQDHSRGRNQVPTSKQPAQRYVQPGVPYAYEDMQRPYIHPSEQQAPEPKIYAGSAIPSRSFKMLQAMTTPENAAETEASGVEYEQIYPHNCYPYPYHYPVPFYPPPMDPNWRYYYPPPPPPYFYYYPECDSKMLEHGWRATSNEPYFFKNQSDHYNGIRNDALIENNQNTTPSIVISSATDEEAKEVVEDHSFTPAPPPHESSPLNLLSKKLTEIVSPSLEKKEDHIHCNNNKEEKIEEQIFDRKPYFQRKLSLSNSSESIEALSSSSSENNVENGEPEGHNDGLRAIKSVTNIKVFETVDDVSKIGMGNYESSESSDENEEEQDHSSSDSRDTTAEEIEDDGEDQSDLDEAEDLTEEMEVAIKEQLSVIYEESEVDGLSKNKSSGNHSHASTLSNSLTTIANDDEEENSDIIESDSDECEDIETDTSEDEDKDEDFSPDLHEKAVVKNDVSKEDTSSFKASKADSSSEENDSSKEEDEEEKPSTAVLNREDEENNEDNGNLVIVRLPLKLSFSRSSNDEEITTVEVGNSEMEDDKGESIYDKKIEDKTTNDEEECLSNDGEESDDGDNESSREQIMYSSNKKSDEPDVSVTLSLPSRSSSMDKTSNLRQNSSFDSIGSKDYNDCDSEVSVSLSLPLKRNKSKSKSITNEVVSREDSEKRTPWNDSFSRVSWDCSLTDEKNIKSTDNVSTGEYNTSEDTAYNLTKSSTPILENKNKTVKLSAIDTAKNLALFENINATYGVISRDTVKNLDRSLRALSMSRMSDYEKQSELTASVDLLSSKTSEIGSRYAQREQRESVSTLRRRNSMSSANSRKARSLSRDILKDFNELKDIWEKYEKTDQSTTGISYNGEDKNENGNESDGSNDSLEMFPYRPKTNQNQSFQKEKEKEKESHNSESSDDEISRIDKKLERLARSTRSLSRDIVKDTKQENSTYDKFEVTFRNNNRQLDRKHRPVSSGVLEGNLRLEDKRNSWTPKFETTCDTKNSDTFVEFEELNKQLESKNTNIVNTAVKALSRDIIRDVGKMTECLDLFDKSTEPELKLLDEAGPSSINDLNEEMKVCVREKIAAFEMAALGECINQSNQSPEPPVPMSREERESTHRLRVNELNDNGSIQKSESGDLEEDDSGVTSDMSKPVSETDTESECFPELRKMSRYQRASTHSRLFKLLQDEAVPEDNRSSSVEVEAVSQEKKENPKLFRSKKKIVHNVSITRRNNPELIKEAETMAERRERLSLPIRLSTSIDADNLSSSNSPSSPTSSKNVISEKLINELVQSLLLKKKSEYLSSLPMEKLQAAAKKVLEEEFDSLENTSLDSTPALTPQEFKNDYSKSYNDYYETWSTNDSGRRTISDILPSKAFRNLQEQALSGRKRLWAARCPRVLSSKTINRDLSRVTESRESESPDNYRTSPSCSSSNGTLDICSDLARDDCAPKLGQI